MLLAGPGCDPEGRKLVVRTWREGVPGCYPPDTLILDPAGEVLARLLGNTTAEEALAILRGVLRDRPDLARRPRPVPEPEAAVLAGLTALEALRDSFRWTAPEDSLRAVEGWLAEHAGACPDEAAEARLLRGAALFRRGDFVQADAAWAELIADHPDHPLRHRAAFCRRNPSTWNNLHPLLQGADRPGITDLPPIVPDRDRFDAHRCAVETGDRYAAGPACLPLVPIPAGRFRMGGSPALFARELPVREVTLTRSFWMSAWPVTRRAWRLFEADAWPGAESDGLAGELPATGMTYWEAVRFCAFLSSITGLSCRLPTEAEWEYAARGGLESAPYPWGWREIDPDLCNYSLPRPVPVGCYPANAFGLFDMVGNVAEWTSDPFADDAYSRTGAACEAPPGPARVHPAMRAVRGGFCGSEVCAVMCRNAWRLGMLEPHRGTVGLRIVVESVRVRRAGSPLILPVLRIAHPAPAACPPEDR